MKKLGLKNVPKFDRTERTTPKLASGARSRQVHKYTFVEMMWHSVQYLNYGVPAILVNTWGPIDAAE